MTHEKLVAGTTSPTRYTKIIRNPGAGTKYNRTYQETDYVSRYTKTVAGGKDYVPPAPPFDPLAIAEGKGSNWLNTNVYEVGQTVEGRTAEFTGGLEPITYRYRFQFKATGSDTWVNGSWTNTTNAKNPVTYELTETGQIKLQSQARDSQDPVVQLNSVAGVKTVKEPIPPTTIGVLSIAPPNTSAEPSGVVVCDAIISGDAEDSMFVWTIRSGPATIISTFNFGNQIQVQVNADATHGESIQVQCDASNSTSTDSPQSTIAVIVVQIPGN